MEFGPVPPARFDEVIQHLRLSFPDEPLNVSIGLCKYGEPCELLEHHDLMTLQEGLSVMAVDVKTGEIAGVALNGISRPGDVEKALEEMASIDNLQFHRIFGLLHNANKELDLFTKYDTDKIFELRILSVGSNFRGRGLAKELCVRSELIAEECGAKIIKVDATSLFTQKICESAGFKSIKDIRYHDFKDENGKIIYNTESPHDFYKVMIKELPSKKNSG